MSGHKHALNELRKLVDAGHIKSQLFEAMQKEHDDWMKRMEIETLKPLYTPEGVKKDERV